jgi:hypothetical protein
VGRELSEILKEALAIPAGARAALADPLLRSVDRKFYEGAHEELERRIQVRIAEVEAGAVKNGSLE